MRVVSLLPAATEIIGALGALENLVGVTHECDFPDVVCSRARVTSSAVDGSAAPDDVDRRVREVSSSGASLFTLHERTIAALRPDLIITQALCDVCAVSEADVRAMATRLPGPPRVLTLEATSLDGMLGDIQRVAAALGVPDECEELCDGLRARLRRIHDTLAAAAAPRPRVAVIEWTDPLYVAGHWVPEMVRRAGGTDIAGSADQHSHVVSPADLLAADPAIVVVAPCGFALDRATAAARQLIADPASSWLRDRAVWAVDGNGLVSRPGPRLIDGVEVLARIFNGGLFSPIAPEHATRLA